MLAFHVETAAAIDAVATTADVVHSDAVPGFERGHGRPDLRYDARGLVARRNVGVSGQAEYGAPPPIWSGTVVHVQVAPAQPGRLQRNQDLAGTWLGDVNRPDLDLPTAGKEHRPHSFVPFISSRILLLLSPGGCQFTQVQPGP
jgi:hypothetical protein